MSCLMWSCFITKTWKERQFLLNRNELWEVIQAQLKLFVIKAIKVVWCKLIFWCLQSWLDNVLLDIAETFTETNPNPSEVLYLTCAPQCLGQFREKSPQCPTTLSCSISRTASPRSCSCRSCCSTVHRGRRRPRTWRLGRMKRCYCFCGIHIAL